MEYIGKRISIKRADNETSIVILSTSDKVKKTILFIVFVLWSLSGVAVLTQYFLLKDQQQRIAIMVWLGFWAYFEYRLYKFLIIF